MDVIINWFQQLYSNFAPFFILLGLLIFVHELGHFLVAKFFGVRVEVFSLGFGKKILQFKRGDTTYCISIVPLGGYVKMFGDDPTAAISEEEKKYAFLHKPVFPRIAIVLAGPLMNLFFAGFLYFLIAIVGDELPGPVVGDVPQSSAAYQAGFRSGDKIVRVNQTDIYSWSDVRQFLDKSANRKLSFEVETAGSSDLRTLEVTPQFGDNPNILSRQSVVGAIDGFGNESLIALIGVSDPQSLAAQAGLQTFDVIVGIEGEKISYWREFSEKLLTAMQKGQPAIRLQVRQFEAAETEHFREVTLTLPAPQKKIEPQLINLGIESAELYFMRVVKDSPAAKIGLLAGDRILSVNGKTIEKWTEVIEQVKTFSPDGSALNVTVSRSGESKSFELRPELTELMSVKGLSEKRFTIGIVSGFMHVGPPNVIFRAHGLIQALTLGLHKTIESTDLVIMSLVRLVQGEVSAKNVSGVLTIGRVASHSFNAGLSYFLKMMAFISINLFLMNLLPVPVLDGGHLIFFTIEALRGAPLSMRKMEIAQQIGLALLMSLMVFALYNDITNWLNLGW